MKILIVEDSEKLSRSLQKGLQKSGFIVDVVANGKHAIHCLELNQYEVIVLDIMMPELDGFGVLDWLRLRDIETKVIILSAKDTVKERVEGLEKGANDYLVKPFAFEELLARIRVQSREYHEISEISSFGKFELDINQRILSIESIVVPLTLSEYNLIEYLCMRKNKMFSKQVLRNHLYDIDSDVDAQVIEVMVSHVRSKLKKLDITEPLIQNRRGYGYYVAG